MSNYAILQAEKAAQVAIHTHLMRDILPSAQFYLSDLAVLLMLFGALIILLAVFIKDKQRQTSYAKNFAIFITSIAAVYNICNSYSIPSAFLAKAVLIDPISNVAFTIISLGTLFTIFAASATKIGKQLLSYELLALLLLSSAGLMIMSCAGEFISFFIGFEITSIALYILVGYQNKSIFSLEAAIKYFLLGATAAAILLMGAAFIYASIGNLQFSSLHLLNISHPFSLLGLFFLLCGLVFKLAIAPFHSWAPDVYQGANAHLSGYMASLVKFTLAMVLLRILKTNFDSGIPHGIIVLFCIFAVLSIAIGSLYGLVQSSIKRLLAYSSIANAGYICLAFVSLLAQPAHSLLAQQSLINFLIVYVVLSLGAFTVVAWLEDLTDREDLLHRELAGIGNKQACAAFALSIFLLGFAGIPPIAGFFVKLGLIISAIQAGFTWLALILIIFSSISLYYYLSIISKLWFKPSLHSDIKLGESNSTLKILCCIAVLVSFWLGIFGLHSI